MGHDVIASILDNHAGHFALRAFHLLAKPSANRHGIARMVLDFLAWMGYFWACHTQMNQGPAQAGIYCIRNTVSGRRYVGSSLNIRQRWFSHRSLLLKGMHHSPTLLRSWLKHGESAFVFEVLEIVETPSILLEREQFWIDEFESADPRMGFNMPPTAGNCKGCKKSKEERAKMSAMRSGKPKSPEGREHIAASNRIRNKSQEMREKVRASKLKLYSRPEKREELRCHVLKLWQSRRAAGIHWRNPHTEETKKRLSIAKKGHMTAEHKAAIALSNKKRAWKLRSLRDPNQGSLVFGPAIHS